MTSLAPTECSFWEIQPKGRLEKATDAEINEKYVSREWRIVTESNREQLPNFVNALNRAGWMELRPFYQRRKRWDPTRQSKLIESFIMNIPVPPLFVYESDYARYEVMDGQQRITAIKDFYDGNLKLRGLQQWPELNGCTYSKLPSEVRKGIDRRSISYIVLLKESAKTTEEEALLRQLVFERLNTGGIKLTPQEIRNCLYHGPFNELLTELAKSSLFRSIWGLPQYTSEEEESPPDELLRQPFYAKMRDHEVILRFFALRHVEHFRSGMQGFLDLYMVKARDFPSDDLQYLRSLLTDVLELGHAIYDEYFLHPWDTGKNDWAQRPQVAFADAVMVGLSRKLRDRDILRKNRRAVVNATKQLFQVHPKGTFTGAANTKADNVQRLQLFASMLDDVIGD